MENQEHAYRPNLRAYIAGFASAVLLTLMAFGLAYIHISSDHQKFSHEMLTYTLVVLALVQLAAQSAFFLHLSRRREDRHKLMTYFFTIYTVAFIVIGSLWIIRNLNNNMSPEQVAKYMHNEN